MVADINAINPEAGSHAVTHDPVEIQAAENSVNAMWTQFPYLGHRYEARGKKFALSDSCWLVTLVRSPEKYIIDQICWLGVVLSSRGMPQLVLEKHIKILVTELVKVHPEKHAEYDKLTVAEKHLRSRRICIISNQQLEDLAKEFEKNVGDTYNRRYKNMGSILVAAVIDEKLGIENAVSSVEEWVTDSTRFDELWIKSVCSIIKRARNLAKFTDTSI